MIKIFRNIRRKLLKENKTIGYLKYAVGEILLVVIGILIALQVNNWNEERKFKLQEALILRDIKSDLQASILEVNDNIAFNSRTIKNNLKIITYLEKDLPYDTSLDTVFGQITNWASPYFSYSAYESLKNKGLDLIENDRLRKDIVHLYDYEFANLIKDYDHSEWVLAQSVRYPIFNEHIRVSLDYDPTKPTSGKPNDYEGLKRNDAFINMLHKIVDTRNHGITKLNEVKFQIQNVIKGIDQELKK
ncbi:DUF6090 family protein [Gaetbulibacter aestuarii]|uniref:DUF6090 family protein n=1 Tax=Gaetbulibacter aestuarii TaxID=1502358 RepID=A0ABW7MVZ5_9FLAO